MGLLFLCTYKYLIFRFHFFLGFCSSFTFNFLFLAFVVFDVLSSQWRMTIRRREIGIEKVGQSRLILNSDHGGAQEKGTFYPIQIWPQKGRNSFSFFSKLGRIEKRSRKSWHGMENHENHEISNPKSKSPNPLFSNEAWSVFVFLLRNPILQLSGSENHTKEIRLSVSFKGKVIEVFIYTLFDDIYICTLFDHILSQKLTNI